MNKTWVVWAMLWLAVWGIPAFAEDAKPATPQAGCCMNPDMMKQMGMAPEMMQRMQVFMRIPLFLDSPGAITAQADKLGLSDDQRNKLAEIEAEARRKAAAVLNADQRAKLGDVSEKPMVMMEMCQQMMQKMMPGCGMQGCPMFGMMTKPSGEKPAPEKPTEPQPK